MTTVLVFAALFAMPFLIIALYEFEGWSAWRDHRPPRW